MGEKFEKYQKKHYYSLLKLMKESHEMVVDAYVRGGVDVSDKRFSGEPFDLDFWRTRANAFEDAYRHIYEYYRTSRLRLEKIGETFEKKKQDTAK